MSMNKLVYNDQVVQSLTSSIKHGGANLANIPGLTKRVIKEEMWRERTLSEAGMRTGEVVCFNSFAEFVIAEPPDGLGIDLVTLNRLCSDDIEALDLIDQATTGRPGAPKGNRNISGIHNSNGYNINHYVMESNKGTSRQYALRRLRRNHPGLHARVLADEISPHAAMIEAGFRTKTITVALDPERAARSIRRHFSREQVRELVDLLGKA
jgi:hypothetical protein